MNFIWEGETRNEDLGHWRLRSTMGCAGAQDKLFDFAEWTSSLVQSANSPCRANAVPWNNLVLISPVTEQRDRVAWGIDDI